MPPAVSVVIPVRDRAHLLGRAVRSALAQTLTDLEVLVVDDASADDPARVVDELGDARVRLIRRAQPGGAGAARNAGVEAARGAIIAFLDSDDEWLPLALERRMARLAQCPDPARAVVYCLYQRHDALTRRTVPSRRATPEGAALEALLTDWNTPPSTLLLPRAFFLEVGGFDATLSTSEDYDLWLRLAQASADFRPVREALTVMHHHEGPQVSSDPVERQRTHAVLEARWGPVVRATLGDAAHARWLSRQRAAIQKARFMRVRELVFRRERRQAWRQWQVMLADRSLSRQHLLQALLLLGGGARLYGLIARLENRLRHAARRWRPR